MYVVNTHGEGPCLDGYRALFIGSTAAQVAAIRGERARIQFRGFSPEELAKLAGYGHDLNTARAEARRLLREAGVAEGLSFTLMATGVTQLFESIEPAPSLMGAWVKLPIVAAPAAARKPEG